MGISFTCKGGAKRKHTMDLRGLPLRAVAELAKSWCFEEATLGVAALNAYYAQKPLLDPLGAVYDPPVERSERGSRGGVPPRDAFEQYRPRIEAAGEARGGDGRARVTVIGHFPHVDRIAEYADLTVLERNCTQALDTPDPACEYVLPKSDYTFITGVTIINKTAPRLLDLTKNGTTVMVGPSVVMSPFLFDWGVEMLAGSVVADPAEEGMNMITRTFKQVELNGQKTILTERAINALNKAGVKVGSVKEVKMVMDEKIFIDNATVIE